MPDFLTRRNGTWHFVRRVPVELAALDPRGVIRHSTKVRVAADRTGRRAARVAEKLNSELESYWHGLVGDRSDDTTRGYDDARSRLVAKVDSAAIQDGFDLYLHGFIVADDGHWVVVQQGMNGDQKVARRYHWISEGLKNFIDEPHEAIEGPGQGVIVNLTDHRAEASRQGQLDLLSNWGPDKILREFAKLQPEPPAPAQAMLPHLVMPAHHDVRASDIHVRRLHGNLAAAADRGPADFSELLLTPGVGARTIKALALVAEVVHGAPCRFSDPARFSLAHGGKDLGNGARDIGFEVVSNPLVFVDRTIVLVRGSREQLARGADLLGIIAEVRKAKVTADFFSALTPAEQHEWSDELLQRLTPPPPGAPAVGLLDTGVNHAHPLLAPVMADGDVHTLKPPWGVHDTHPDGHGTQMAGLAIYGDLSPMLDSTEAVELTHGVQSLKLIHPTDPHREELYGAVTIEAVSRLEIDAARRRVYCMAITADDRDRGRPSSWSAAIDNLACGAINDTQRLIIISTGNVEQADRIHYPAYNETAGVQDPAQAWNALTVGGYTEKALVDQDENPGWTALAAHGDLAPASRTSMTWPKSRKTPLKPDIVMEAGNMGQPPGAGAPDFLDELQLLTSNRQFAAGQRPFVTFQDTSAASALAANLATRLLARYPHFTPKALRGFMVHASRWTPAMIARATDLQGRVDIERLLRTFGYGTPNLEALFYSANNVLTLIADDTLQPYFKDPDGGGIKTHDIKYHSLPWPREALLALPLDTQIEMRVTLSYFVEPSPGERGWDRKYGYPSHGLRFKVKRASETLSEFKLRINAHDREDEYDEDHLRDGQMGVRGDGSHEWLDSFKYVARHSRRFGGSRLYCHSAYSWLVANPAQSEPI
jgi:hypothetical protein